ncbi:MFS transporter [Streptomyces roseicoloratus]|uniref:Tetracycline resistance protein n=1 Tax=Streptomyces roseicoloratus TaxID=2508722 RepID=A0ABY9S3A2_9ACTN|nr:MFS transporter [Streptomyces roseicoloratus]WMX48876.1 MFS transporter [Streptomyces roseicoloratus]
MRPRPAVPTARRPAPAPAVPVHAARSAGLRYGALFGPAVFGVTAAGVALPDVAGALHATPATAAWGLTAHALALGVGTALFGRLADARGVRVSLLVGSLVLAVGAVVCLFAPDIGVLVAGRFVLAAGSGAMTSGALALTASAPPADRPRVLGGFGATMAVFSAGATLAGGVLTQWASWRIVLVLPALSLLAVPLCLRAAAARAGSGRRLDLPGAVLLTVAAMSFLLLVQSYALGLAGPLVAGLVVALAGSLVGLVRRVRTVEGSFVPRRLVADRMFLRASLTGAGAYAGLFAAMYLVPQILVGGHGWSVLAVGTWLLPGAVAGAVLSRFAGRFAGGRAGSVLLGLIALAMAVVLAGSAVTGSPAPPLVGASLGFAAFAVTQVVTTALMSTHVEPSLRGGAMGLLNLGFFVGGGVGSATAGALVKSMELTGVLAVVAVFPLAAAAAAFRTGAVTAP